MLIAPNQKADVGSIMVKLGMESLLVSRPWLDLQLSFRRSRYVWLFSHHFPNPTVCVIIESFNTRELD
jgi:hypothetical protein